MNNKLLASFIHLWNLRYELSVRNIWTDYWQYFLAFPTIMIIYYISKGFFQYDIMPLGLSLFTLLFGAAGAAALLTVVSSLRWLKAYTVAWTVCLLIGVIACRLLPQGPIWLFSALCYWAGIGGCGVCSFYAYIFVLKNAGRFWGIILFVISLGFDIFLYNSLLVHSTANNNLLFIMVLIAAVCFYRFNLPHNLPRRLREKEKIPIPVPVYSILICITVFSAIVMFGDCGMIASVGVDGYYLFGAGIISSAVLAVLMQVVFNRSIWHSWNSFLGFSIIGLGLMMSKNITAIGTGTFLYGFARGMGNISLYYLSGGLLKKYFSISLSNIAVFYFCFIMVFFNTISQFILSHMPESAIYTGFLVSVFSMIVCMFVSPVFSQYIFYTDWMDEYHNEDMTIIFTKLEKTDRFENISLTPREKEVCTLLLEGLTLRQISSELGITHATVNTHYKNLYKKLGVNSRTELILKFGLGPPAKNS